MSRLSGGSFKAVFATDTALSDRRHTILSEIPSVRFRSANCEVRNKNTLAFNGAGRLHHLLSHDSSQSEAIVIDVTPVLR